MTYTVLIRRKAQKQLDGIQEDWRIRVGDYRVIYGVDDARRVVEVLKVAHRRESYR